MQFITVDTGLVAVDEIQLVDTSQLNKAKLNLTLKSGQVLTASGTYAVEAAYLLKPSVLEGKKLRWLKNAWALHNLVAHPMMQILAWLGLARLGIKLHDQTVPKPTGLKSG